MNFMPGDGVPEDVLEAIGRTFPVLAGTYFHRLRNEPGFAIEPRRRKALEGVLWMYAAGPHVPPGDFRQKLMALIDKADEANLARLSVSFPDEVLMTWMCKNMPQGTSQLQAVKTGLDAGAFMDESGFFS